MKRYKVTQKNKPDMFYHDYKKALRYAVTICYHGDDVILFDNNKLQNIIKKNVFGKLTIE